MKKFLVVVSAAALVALGAAGMAGTGSSHEAKQDLRIWQARTVIRQLWYRNAKLEYRLNLLTCEPQPDCRGGVELTWQMLGDQWTGWPQKP